MHLVVHATPCQRSEKRATCTTRCGLSVCHLHAEQTCLLGMVDMLANHGIGLLHLLSRLSTPRMHAPRIIAQRPSASLAAGAPQPRQAAAIPRTNIKPKAVLAEAPARQTQGPIILNGQVLHSITQERLELIGGMDDYVEQEIVPLLKPVDKCWQPADYLPAPESPDFLDAVCC